MTRMTIDIPDDEYKKLKITAIQIGVSIKDYVLEALRLKAKILVRDDGVVRVLNNDTIAAFEESRGSEHKLPAFDTTDEAFAYLDKSIKTKK
jgi:hypothetical protein